MHLRIDDARKDMQATAVNGFRRRARHLADGYDLPGADAEIADAFTILIDDGRAFEDEIVSCGHHPSARFRSS